MSPLVAPLMVASGLLACAIAVGALRMVMADWNRRIDLARRQTLGHVVWRPVDAFALWLWSAIYAAGGVSLLAGMFLLFP